ncbi:MAG: phosphoribosyltransferase [Deltaproteobacteria bacterium]|nr:phosphoribosyltransferase [Deltaproteobacteria bacterium]
MNSPGKIIEIPDLRDRVRIFRSREQAGRLLAGLLENFRGTATLILGIPSGGIPVAVALAEELQLPLEAAVVSKITLPWNTEAGYGAVAFDGTVRLNEELLPQLRLTEKQLAEGLEQTKDKVARRVRKFRGDRSWPDLSGRTAVLVDDGLASGFTMLVAVEAVSRLKAQKILVAVPTGSTDRLRKVAREVDALYCANIREGWGFSVAEAYQRWFDLEEEEAVRMVRDYQQKFQPRGAPGTVVKKTD